MPLPASLIRASVVNLAEQLLTGPGPRSGRTAIIAGRERLSYEALTRRVLERARQLIDAGIKPGDRVVLSHPNGAEFAIVWLAIQWIGAVSVALPPAYRRREIEYAVNHSGTAAIVCDADSSTHVRAAQAGFKQTVRMIAFPSEPVAAAPPPPHTTPGSCPAALTYISSAEGPLGGMIHTRAGILATTDAYTTDVIDLKPDNIIGAIGLAWAFGLGSLLVFPFRACAATVLLDSASAGGLLAAIGESRATVLFGVPTTYRMLPPAPGSRSLCPELAPMLRERCRAVAAMGCGRMRARTGLEILDGLGTTQLTTIFISNRQGASRPGFLGTPVAGFSAKVVDDAFQEVPRGRPGRLIVRGPIVARYWNDAEADRRTVRDGWTFTGDVSSNTPTAGSSTCAARTH